MSKIKGGGRAVIGSDAEEAIISLLYDRRDYDNPLKPKMFDLDLNDGSSSDKKFKRYCELSDHDRKKERKKFCKKLLKSYTEFLLASKFNRKSTTETDMISATKSMSMSGTKKSVDKVVSSTEVSGNVRIEIVEAIFKTKKESSSSSKSKKDSKKESKKDSKKKSSKKEKSGKEWKEGTTRKTIVVEKSTSIKDLMKTCKAKLNMKKPTRLFIQDKDTKMEIDLLYDLSGLVDGDIVYATSYTPPTDAKDEGDNSNVDVSNDQIAECIYDPLEDIKKAYRIHGGKKGNKVVKSLDNEVKFPRFADALDKLEKVSEQRAQLPAANFRSEILSSLDKSRVIVISGATGCGKSTQVPQFLLEGMKAIGCEDQANIIVTQPRRVAATALARRVSEERESPAPGKQGSVVGYNVRLNKAVSEDAKIVYCTVGVLLRMMVNPEESCGDDDDYDQDKTSNPIPLSNISHIVLDEVHERDLNTDFALTLLRPVLSANKRISIILMSATASSEVFANYFKSEYIVPIVINIPGRTFPVESLWLQDCEKIVSSQMNGRMDLEDSSYDRNSNDEETEFAVSPRATSKIDNDFITKLVVKIAEQQWKDDKSKNIAEDKPHGTILVFLPGKGEIEQLQRTLLQHPQLGNRAKSSILQLHSNLSPSEQYKAFQPVKYGQVKIILSTNVAETSITISDVTNVIDTGTVKEMRFNSSTRIKELVTVYTSQASAKQRAGRAGRTQKGQCYRLYSKEFASKRMLLHTSPEIVRTPLEELVLQVCLLGEQNSSSGSSPLEFLREAPQPPPPENLEKACQHLLEIGVLVEVPHETKHIFRLTPLGYHLAHLPMDSKIGKILVIGSILRCMEPALTIAATLSAPKSFWLPYIPGIPDSKEKARLVQKELIANGFGGINWPTGTVKGDIIACIAAYNAWDASANSAKGDKNRIRRKFANNHGLDNNALCEIQGLRKQFRDALKVSGIANADETDNIHGQDALLTSCCLVAGLYPNICTLMRPSRERKIRGGRLITKDGNSCKPSSSSFQAESIRNASESGKDRYAVYHGKHLSISAGSAKDPRIKQEPFLSDVNFVSRFAILLFGGEIDVQKNIIFVDEWLKFKVDDEKSSDAERISDKGRVNAVLLSELRKELDVVMLDNIIRSRMHTQGRHDDSEKIIRVIRALLSSES